MTVEVFHWNPLKPVVKGRVGKFIPLRQRANNFGDMLAPLIIRRLLENSGIQFLAQSKNVRLLSIGSVMHFAKSGDVVWGTGVNGKLMEQMKHLPPIDVRSVRGPLTREFLTSRGIQVPEIYGDPGLLLGVLWPEGEFADSSVASDYLVVPNLNDFHDYNGVDHVLNPRQPLMHCIRRIANSNFVMGSSLHAIVLADSLGIPARLIASKQEHSFKYEDYYLGSGRDHFRAAKTMSEAVNMGGENKIDWHSSALLDAFPRDLWE